MMGERRGRPGWATLIMVVTVLGTGFLFLLGVGLLVPFSFQGGTGSPLNPGLGGAMLGAAAFVLFVGLWCAWRVGTGSWSLNRGFTSGSPAEPPDPGAQAAAEGEGGGDG
jgi:hypothetical protein